MGNLNEGDGHKASGPAFVDQAQARAERERDRRARTQELLSIGNDRVALFDSLGIDERLHDINARFLHMAARVRNTGDVATAREAGKEYSLEGQIETPGHVIETERVGKIGKPYSKEFMTSPLDEKGNPGDPERYVEWYQEEEYVVSGWHPIGNYHDLHLWVGFHSPTERDLAMISVVDSRTRFSIDPKQKLKPNWKVDNHLAHNIILTPWVTRSKYNHDSLVLQFPVSDFDADRINAFIDDALAQSCATFLAIERDETQRLMIDKMRIEDRIGETTRTVTRLISSNGPYPVER